MKKAKWVTKEFFLKGMVCSRCLKVLSNELSMMGSEVLELELGRILLRFESQKLELEKIEEIITENGFEIIQDKDSILAEQVKQWIISSIWNEEKKENLSELLTHKMHRNYSSISKLFSKCYHKTIERYYILVKIERVKECIRNDTMNFSEIADALGYQNLSALSRQFKKETGMSMRDYKKNKMEARIPLDKI